MSHVTACGILVPQPGIEPMPSALEAQVLVTEPLEKPQTTSYQKYLCFCNPLSHRLYRLVSVSKKMKKMFLLNITTFRNISIISHQIRQNYLSFSMFAPVNAQDTLDLHPMQTLS